MNSIRIGDIEFPLRAISEMKFLRDRYQEGIHSTSMQNRSDLHVLSPGISSPSLISMRDFMTQFPNIHVQIILPRMKPVRDIIGDDLWRWISNLDKHRLIQLHKDAYAIGYSVLFEITSLVLSEDIDYESL